MDMIELRTAHTADLEAELEDATGAGDVFSAAVLSSLTSMRLKIELGAFLGLSLAQAKAAQTSPGEIVLPDLSRGFLERIETLNSPQTAPRGVFLVHHQGAYREVVRRFIEGDCGLPVYELTSSDIAKRDLVATLSEQLPKCSFAVCLLGRTSQWLTVGSARTRTSSTRQASCRAGTGLGELRSWPKRGSSRSLTSRGSSDSIFLRLRWTAPSSIYSGCSNARD